MGQSLVKNYMRLILAQNIGSLLIFPPVEEPLYHFLGGICADLQSPALKVGGHYNQVHILCNVSKNIAVFKLVQPIKLRSSLWIKEQGSMYENFYRQDGYGALSVGRSELARTELCIENQKEHHGLVCYQNEYRAILRA